MKRKQIFYILLTLLLCTCVVCVKETKSYFTDQSETVNMMSIGQNTIRIKEDFQPPKTLTVGENKYKKKIQVENTGTIPCFVRVYMAFSDSRIEACSTLSSDGRTFVSAKEFSQHLPKGWIFIPETMDTMLGGYYYYIRELQPGEKTETLLHSINTSFDTADDIMEYDIIVYAESIQTLDKEGDPFIQEDGWKQAWNEFLERK